MHEAVQRRIALETRLRRALATGGFRLHFQPIVTLSDGRLHSFEALLRWRDATPQCPTPKEFIPIAEETGLILPLGQWVLTEACTQMKQWQDDPAIASLPSLAVNISRRQLLTPDFGPMLRSIISTAGIDPSYLSLEVTESTAMEVAHRLPSVLRQIRSLGVEIHLDDFGTGESSLSCLQSFPIDTLKLDRKFIQGLQTGRVGGAGLVAGVLSIARGLGIDVVAEGVETQDVLASLVASDCSYAQGFYFSEAVAASVAREIMLRGGGWQGNASLELIGIENP
jgi:EAL domain-containing protein (putative c-di-GMP-specific phosphodiesterase class I)